MDFILTEVSQVDEGLNSANTALRCEYFRWEIVCLYISNSPNIFGPKVQRLPSGRTRTSVTFQLHQASDVSD